MVDCTMVCLRDDVMSPTSGNVVPCLLLCLLGILTILIACCIPSMWTVCSAFTVTGEVPFFSSGSNVVTLGCAELRNIL